MFRFLVKDSDRLFNRFMKHVSIPDGINNLKTSDDCWLWNASKDKDGYGKFEIAIITNKGTKSYRSIGAHRISWYLFKSNSFKDLQVLHTCDVRHCVNPNHLWLGNNADNMLDKVNKNRQAKGSLLSKSVKANSAKGERNCKAKLTVLQVEEIRLLYSQGIKRSVIAKQFSICWTTVDAIVRYKHWKHVK